MTLPPATPPLAGSIAVAGAVPPHADRPVAALGPAVERAKAVMIMIHGRGASASSILELAAVFAQPDLAYLAPEAAGRTWYPQSFLAPIDENEPGLSAGLALIDQLVGKLEAGGIAPRQIALLGFSQGACLALDYAARHPRRFGTVIGLSGGLIGPEGSLRPYDGSLDGTPVFLGCSDVDPHIPLLRVRETTSILRELGAIVDERIYPGMGHGIVEDEIKAIRGLIAGMLHPRILDKPKDT